MHKKRRALFIFVFILILLLVIGLMYCAVTGTVPNLQIV